MVEQEVADRHYWVESRLNGGLRNIYLFHGKQTLIEEMNEMIVAAGEEISVPVAAALYSMQNEVAVKSNKFGIEILFQVSDGYTEEEMIAAGLLDRPEQVQLDPMWYNMYTGGENVTAGVAYD